MEETVGERDRGRCPTAGLSLSPLPNGGRGAGAGGGVGVCHAERSRSISQAFLVVPAEAGTSQPRAGGEGPGLGDGARPCHAERSRSISQAFLVVPAEAGTSQPRAGSESHHSDTRPLPHRPLTPYHVRMDVSPCLRPAPGAPSEGVSEIVGLCRIHVGLCRIWCREKSGVPTGEAAVAGVKPAKSDSSRKNAPRPSGRPQRSLSRGFRARRSSVPPTALSAALMAKMRK